MGGSSGFWCSAITRFQACRRSAESDLSWSVRWKRAAAFCWTNETYEDRDFMLHLIGDEIVHRSSNLLRDVRTAYWTFIHHGEFETRAADRRDPGPRSNGRPRQWPPRVKTVVRRPYDFTLLGSLRSICATRHRLAWPRGEPRCWETAVTGARGRVETGRCLASSSGPCRAAEARTVAPRFVSS